MYFCPIPFGRNLLRCAGVRNRTPEGVNRAPEEADRRGRPECKSRRRTVRRQGIRVAFAQGVGVLRNRRHIRTGQFILPVAVRGEGTAIGRFVPSNFEFGNRAPAGAAVTAAANGARALFPAKSSEAGVHKERSPYEG